MAKKKTTKTKKKKNPLSPEAVYKLILENSGPALVKHPVDDLQRFMRTVHTIIRQESNFDPEAREAVLNPFGRSIGLSQFTPATQKDTESHYGWKHRSSDARLEPAYAVQLACAYLAWNLATSGDWTTAIYQYNQGHWATFQKSGWGWTYTQQVLDKYGKVDWAAIEGTSGIQSSATYVLLGEFY